MTAPRNSRARRPSTSPVKAGKALDIEPRGMNMTTLKNVSRSHRTARILGSSSLIGQTLALLAVLSGCEPADSTPPGAETGRVADAAAGADAGIDRGAPATPTATVLVAAQTCTGGSQCASGFCVDGVCCDTACGGTCQSCSMTGKVGTCSPVLDAQDDTCDGQSTCDSSGNCRTGLGKACSAGADCASGSCVDGVCCSTSACGTCQSCAVPGSVGICAPVAKLTDDPDSCTGLDTCNGLGACQLKPGSPCDSASSCVSQQCADGVCCDEACGDTCYGCNQAGSVGTCKPIDGAEDLTATVTCSGGSICAVSGGAAPSCKLKDGQPCTSNDQCVNGSCLTSYLDADGDGFGGAAVRRCELKPQPGYVTEAGDCCDADAHAHPGVTAYSSAKDACGSYDWNCNGVDERSASSTVNCGCVSFGKFGDTCGACR
jgi:hypothetical protein